MSATHPTFALPDPANRPEFYDGVVIKRLIAWALDLALLLVLATAVFLLTVIPAVLTVFGIFLLPAIIMMLGFIYRWVTLSRGSATLGMRMMAIEIREADGSRLRNSTALYHTIGYYMSMGMCVVQLASIVMMLSSSRKQGLTDMVLDTAAINRPAAGW